MKRKFNKIILSMAALMLVACAGNKGNSVSTEPQTQTPVQAQTPAQTKTLPDGTPLYDDAAVNASYYMQQLAAIRADSLKAVETTDWKKFRKEFLRCRLSQPDRFGTVGIETVINLARKSGDTEEQLKMSQELLNINFTNISAHYAFLSSPTTDESVKEFHKQVIKGLLNSIRESGQGNSTANAIYVISVDEEYDFIYLSGFKPVRQELIEENGRYYDRLITEAEGKKYQFYFDISDFYKYY